MWIEQVSLTPAQARVLGRALDQIDAASSGKSLIDHAVGIKQVSAGRFAAQLGPHKVELDLDQGTSRCGCNKRERGLCAHAGALAWGLVARLETYTVVSSETVAKIGPDFNFERVGVAKSTPALFVCIDGVVMDSTLRSLRFAQPGSASFWVPKSQLLLDARSLKAGCRAVRAFVCAYYARRKMPWMVDEHLAA